MGYTGNAVSRANGNGPGGGIGGLSGGNNAGLVADDGSIYVAGHVGPKFSSLGRATKVKGDASGRNVYLGKLDKDLTKIPPAELGAHLRDIMRL